MVSALAVMTPSYLAISHDSSIDLSYNVDAVSVLRLDYSASEPIDLFVPSELMLEPCEEF